MIFACLSLSMIPWDSPRESSVWTKAGVHFWGIDTAWVSNLTRAFKGDVCVWDTVWKLQAHKHQWLPCPSQQGPPAMQRLLFQQTGPQTFHVPFHILCSIGSVFEYGSANIMNYLLIQKRAHHWRLCFRVIAKWTSLRTLPFPALPYQDASYMKTAARCSVTVIGLWA